jgi:hypothetical protein
MTTMADLTPGTRVRHAGGDCGTIRVCGCVTEFHPDDYFGDIEVSPEGPFFPSDLAVLPAPEGTAR